MEYFNNPFMAQIAGHEGYKDRVYKDTEGHLTVGYGHKLTGDELKKFKEGDIIDQKTLNDWFKKDFAKANAYAKEKLPEGAPPGLEGVLTNMAFQMGESGVNKFKDMHSALKRGDYTTAANEMLDSKWAEQTPNRANDLASQVRDFSKGALDMHNSTGVMMLPQESDEEKKLKEQQQRFSNAVMQGAVDTDAGRVLDGIGKAVDASVPVNPAEEQVIVPGNDPSGFKAGMQAMAEAGATEELAKEAAEAEEKGLLDRAKDGASNYLGTLGRMTGISEDYSYDDPMSPQFEGPRSKEEQKAFDEEQTRRKLLKGAGGALAGGALAAAMYDPNASKSSSASSARASGGGKLGTGGTFQDYLGFKR